MVIFINSLFVDIFVVFKVFLDIIKFINNDFYCNLMFFNYLFNSVFSFFVCEVILLCEGYLERLDYF